MNDDLPDSGVRPEADEVGRTRTAAGGATGAGGGRGEPRRGQADPPRELNGRGGLDPSRYGDWEVKGLASDF